MGSPLGKLLCNGQEKGNDEDKFKELFKTIQYSWGKGESGNTFFLPDLRGRFLRGVDYNANRDPDKEKRGSDHNGNTGNKVGFIQEDAYKKHYHDLKLGGIAGKDKADSGSQKDSGTVKTEYSEDSGENCPKNAYVNWIIKYK